MPNTPYSDYENEDNHRDLGEPSSKGNTGHYNPADVKKEEQKPVAAPLGNKE